MHTVEEVYGPVANAAPVSKRLRFEVFKRDGFTCQYCGTRPPDVILELDHIEPRAVGGGNDNINLITSCFDCNRGKGKRELGHVTIRPDADIEFFRTQQEIAEAKRFLLAKVELDRVRATVVDTIQDHWDHLLRMEEHAVPADAVVLGWLNRYSPEEVIAAVDIFSRIYLQKSHTFNRFEKCVSYMGGILRNKRDGL